MKNDADRLMFVTKFLKDFIEQREAALDAVAHGSCANQLFGSRYEANEAETEVAFAKKIVAMLTAGTIDFLAGE